MNKKGFTLTELLAVIVILAVVGLIGTVSITGVKRKMNENMFRNKLAEVISAGSKWGEDNKDLLDRTDVVSGHPYTEKTVGFLIQENYLNTEEKVLPEKYNYNATVCTDEGGIMNNTTGLCENVITNNVDYKIINSLELKIYRENNRVYTCIVKNANTKDLLKEDDSYSVYGDLNYYCN